MDTVLECLSDSNLNRSTVNGIDAQGWFQQLRTDNNRITAVKQKQAEKAKENKTQITPPKSITNKQTQQQQQQQQQQQRTIKTKQKQTTTTTTKQRQKQNKTKPTTSKWSKGEEESKQKHRTQQRTTNKQKTAHRQTFFPSKVFRSPLPDRVEVNSVMMWLLLARLVSTL